MSGQVNIDLKNEFDEDKVILDKEGALLSSRIHSTESNMDEEQLYEELDKIKNFKDEFPLPYILMTDKSKGKQQEYGRNGKSSFEVFGRDKMNDFLLENDISIILDTMIQEAEKKQSIYTKFNSDINKNFDGYIKGLSKVTFFEKDIDNYKESAKSKQNFGNLSTSNKLIKHRNKVQQSRSPSVSRKYY